MRARRGARRRRAPPDRQGGRTAVDPRPHRLVRRRQGARVHRDRPHPPRRRPGGRRPRLRPHAAPLPQGLRHPTGSDSTSGIGRPAATVARWHEAAGRALRGAPRAPLATPARAARTSARR